MVNSDVKYTAQTRLVEMQKYKAVVWSFEFLKGFLYILHYCVITYNNSNYTTNCTMSIITL